MANEPAGITPPDGGGGADSDDDAWFDGFMDRIDQMEQKLAKIPEDIGEKLDTIMGQTSGQSTAANSPTPQSTRAPRPAAPQARSVSPSPAVSPPSGTGSDTKPRNRHWYFGERPGKRNG